MIYSIIINLGLLCYFKYAAFFTESYNKIFHTNNEVFNYLAYWSNSVAGSHLSIDRILLPVGISFYTFKIISYSIDVYRGRMQPVTNFFELGYYVSAFPQVLAGPISRARDFIPQLRQPFVLSKYQFGLAIFLILNGLLKKMVVGDYMAIHFIDKVFGNPLLFSGVENLLAVIAYSLQVYLDFSGYTDIATGLSLLMGYRIMKNFNSPYKARNVGEFWKRWHISLSSWLQEYLYIPLGGNRGGSVASYILITILTVFVALMLDAVWVLKYLVIATIVLVALARYSPSFKNVVNTNINLMVTMLLGGLWHESKLTFIVWGGLNGLGLVVYKFWRKISPYEKIKTWPVNAWKVLFTFSFISFTRIFFRADNMDQAKEVMTKITDLDLKILPVILANFWELFTLMAIGFIVHWLPDTVKWEYKKSFIKAPVWAKVVVIILCVVLIYQTSSSESKKFIYFQY